MCLQKIRREVKIWKKIISLFTLVFFMSFSFYCYSIKRERILEIKSDPYIEKIKIIQVVKTSGEKIKFSKRNPEKIVGDKIIGLAVVKRHIVKKVSIPLNFHKIR
jgi:hypothetical protein